MPEINYVTVEIGPNRVVEGFYTVEGGLLSMVYGNGEPVFRADGSRAVHLLAENENPRLIAGRLTRQIRKEILGETVEGFNNPINYANAGWR